MKHVLILLLVLCSSQMSWSDDSLGDLLKKYDLQLKPQNDTKVNEKKLEETREPASTTKAKATKTKLTERKGVVPPKSEAPQKKEETPAESASEEEEEFGLFGDWGGLKPLLGKYGIVPGLGYKGDYVTNMGGGIERKSAYLGNIDVTLDIDLEKLVKAKGLSLSLYGLGNHGDEPTAFVGDSFASSNIEAPSTFKLYEAYLKQNIDDRFSAIFGLRDLNADFYATDSAGNLLNSAFGISSALSQTGVNGPSIFPTAALALTVKYESPTEFYFQTGAFNAKAGDPDQPYGTHINSKVNSGYLFISESGWAKEGDYKFAVGTWTYSKDQEAIDAAKVGGTNWGFYFLVDHKITDNLSGFIKHGLAAPTVNQFKECSEVGLAYTGLIKSREKDVISLGFARGVPSNDYRDANDATSEENVTEISELRSGKASLSRLTTSTL